MRVLVYQQFHPGHHYLYLQHLLPPLAKVASEVIVAVTAEGQASPEFATFLKPLEGVVRFDASLPSGHERVIKNQRIRVYLDVRNAVRRIAPDHVLIPSGDPHTTVMGGFRFAGLGAMPGRRPAEVGIHFGRGAAAATTRDQITDYVNELKLSLAGWQKVHIVNLLFYEQIQRRGGSLARGSVLLPDPTTPNPRLGTIESRRRLGLRGTGQGHRVGRRQRDPGARHPHQYPEEAVHQHRGLQAGEPHHRPEAGRREDHHQEEGRRP